MATIKCPECNRKISDQAMSCPKCGRPLNVSSAFNDFPPPNIGMYTSNADIYTQDMAASAKSRRTALLLCLFLGYFGAHRFYVGKTKSGIVVLIMSFFVFIPNIILWPVDLIKILRGTFTDGEGFPLTQWTWQNKIDGKMKLFKKNKEKNQNYKNQTLSFENGNSTSQNKSKEEIYREKKQQLKYWQTVFENEKQIYENQKIQHDAYVNTVNGELEQIQQQMQIVHKKTKKNMLIFLVFLVVWIFLVGMTMVKIYDFHTKELEGYQQQLETELSEYTSEIETLTQKLDSLK